MTRIRPRDERLLTWYFTRGLSQFERSTMGAMIERLQRDSSGASHCRVCEGVGILETEQAVRRHKHRGKHTELVTRWALKKRDGALVDERVAVAQDVAIGSYCQCCWGTGWVPVRHPRPTTITARPTCGPPESAGVVVDGEVLRDYAIVSRRLCRMAPSHRLTLELYYGQHGLSWGVTPHGRLLALQAGTLAGKRLLARTKRKGDEATAASADERIANEWDAQQRDPKGWRWDLLQAAQLQAHERIQAATASWQLASGAALDKSVSEQWDDLCDRIDATAERVEAWNDEHRAPVRGADGIWRNVG